MRLHAHNSARPRHARHRGPGKQEITIENGAPAAGARCRGTQACQPRAPGTHPHPTQCPQPLRPGKFEPPRAPPHFKQRSNTPGGGNAIRRPKPRAHLGLRELGQGRQQVELLGVGAAIPGPQRLLGDGCLRCRGVTTQLAQQPWAATGQAQHAHHPSPRLSVTMTHWPAPGKGAARHFQIKDKMTHKLHPVGFGQGFLFNRRGLVTDPPAPRSQGDRHSGRGGGWGQYPGRKVLAPATHPPRHVGMGSPRAGHGSGRHSAPYSNPTTQFTQHSLEQVFLGTLLSPPGRTWAVPPAQDNRLRRVTIEGGHGCVVDIRCGGHGDRSDQA